MPSKNDDIRLPEPDPHAMAFIRSVPCHQCGKPMGDHEFTEGIFVCPGQPVTPRPDLSFAVISQSELGTNCWAPKRFVGGQRCPRFNRCTYPEKATCRAGLSELTWYEAQLDRLQLAFDDQMAEMRARIKKLREQYGRAEKCELPGQAEVLDEGACRGGAEAGPEADPGAPPVR